MGRAVLYHGSDGRYYGDADLWARFESGEWRPCCWDLERGIEWVETEHGELLSLTPTSRDDIPDNIRVKHVCDGVTVSPGEAVLSR